MSTSEKLAAVNGILDGAVAGKAAIAQAITSKGIATMEDTSFDTMAINIGLIEGGGGVITKLALPEDVRINGFVLPIPASARFVLLRTSGIRAPTTGGRATTLIVLSDGVCLACTYGNNSNSGALYYSGVASLSINGNVLKSTVGPLTAGPYALLGADKEYDLIYF